MKMMKKRIYVLPNAIKKEEVTRDMEIRGLHCTDQKKVDIEESKAN